VCVCFGKQNNPYSYQNVNSIHTAHSHYFTNCVISAHCQIFMSQWHRITVIPMEDISRRLEGVY